MKIVLIGAELDRVYQIKEDVLKEFSRLENELEL